MPTVIEDLTEGMRSGVSEDGGATLVRIFYLKELIGSGVNRLLSAWDLLGTTMTGDGGAVTIPAANERILFARTSVYAKAFDLQPFGDADAILTVTYREDNAIGAGTTEGVEQEVGTTLEQDETDFTAADMEKPFNQRTPMYILYDPSATGKPSDTAEYRKPVRLPKMVGKSFRRFTKTFGEDPGLISELYVSRTNSILWKGYPPETVLCLSIVGRNAGQGWRTTGDFAIDRRGKFRQIGRAMDDATGEPVVLTQAQVANSNGIAEFVVQGKADFNKLDF